MLRRVTEIKISSMAAPVKKRAVNLEEKNASKNERDSSSDDEGTSSDEETQEYTANEVVILNASFFYRKLNNSLPA